ncbi:hypothetical protein NSE01_32940 [Novosphingobium sediminis]|uniref:Uncharacterized protein n=1 Tax=Novosphingobium sediminis TaxID=707214 RepID=A0A512AP24_9SPHN|nr:hypothetical protein [Novosphingobium sediminis]GEO01462.1 hypothetical protein NSE01_32940 [Novosphingobium sediminis]
MIDIFTVVLPHVLMAIAVWRLLHRDDLDTDPVITDTGEALPPPETWKPAGFARKPRA